MKGYDLLFRFDGRISRARYWLGNAFVYSALVLAAVMATLGKSSVPVVIGALVLMLVALWSFFAVHIKRWHDRNKSGWWMLIGLIPYVGAVWSFVENGCLSGTPGPNKYGPDPLGRERITPARPDMLPV
jgi:uncharacterized membrane protein YhaH (DUF805 family)